MSITLEHWTRPSIGSLAAVALAAAVGCSDSMGASGQCTGTGPSSQQVRVHVDNPSNAPGVKVTLTAGGQTCVIDALIVDDPQGDNELDQVIMDVGLGDVVTIRAEVTGISHSAACTVAQRAFEFPVSENRGQAFASVFFSPLQVVCLDGF